MPMRRVAVGLMGLGTVGGGVARLLLGEADRIARRAGKRIELKGILVRDRSKQRTVEGVSDLLTTDPHRLIDDPEIEVIIETIGGTDRALEWILAALSAGKHVVTANKAVLAEHGGLIFDQARRFGRAVAFEGAVGGGIPIIQALGVALAANEIRSISAILNGTCNFILTSMDQGGLTYSAALSEAQARGYAEADPTLDVDGTDTAHKLAILAQLAFGVNVTIDQIPRGGIDKLQAADVRYAGELGYTVKLLALARLSTAGLALRVAPTLVRRGTPLAEVGGAFNAIRVFGDAVGETLFYGRGAGMLPTASAVVGDLIDVVVGRAELTSNILNLWSNDRCEPSHRRARSDEVRSRYYLRFTIADRPGVLASLARVLGDYAISIASVIQHDPGENDGPGSPVPLVIMTHQATEAGVVAALEHIDKLDVVYAPSVRLGVEE